MLTVFVNLKDAVFIFMAFRKHLILYTVMRRLEDEKSSKVRW